MVPGKDCVESFSPAVATDAGVRTVFTISLHIMDQARLKQWIRELEFERKTRVAKE
jgi:hypothetical protein